MDDEQLSDELDVAGGQGLAALSLQSAILTKLALRGLLSPADLSEIAETAEQLAGSGTIDASEGAVIIAQACIRGLAQTWQKPDKTN